MSIYTILLLTILFYNVSWGNNTPISNNGIKSMFTDTLTVQPSLLPEFDDCYGVAFHDINQDEYPDIYVVRFRNLNRLFINRNGGKKFQDRTIRSGLGGNLGAKGKTILELGASVIDADNDGSMETLITGWGGTTQYYHQLPSTLRFKNITRISGLNKAIDGNAGIWSDIDLDGDLDLFITNEHGKNYLYVQVSSGEFIDKGEQFGFLESGISQGAAFADIDQDGFPDLYVCNWDENDYLYRNLEGIQFERIQLPTAHLTQSFKSNGICFGDIDNDGDLDKLVTDRDGKTQLYLNETDLKTGQWKFTPASANIFTPTGLPGYGVIIADLNNDGWQDIYLSNIGFNYYYQNDRTGHFLPPVTDLINQSGYSTGSAAADFDLDGDLDIFVSNKDISGKLMVNPLKDGHFIRFKIEGVMSNREAIGAKIWLYQDPSDELLLGFREIASGSGYLSTGESIVHFGLDSDSAVSVRILFPSGKEIRIDELIPDQKYTISETGGILKTVYRSKQFVFRILSGTEFYKNLFLFILLATSLFIYNSIAAKRYHWKNRHFTILFFSTLLFLFLLNSILVGRTTDTILLTDLKFVLIELIILTLFLERIKKIDSWRFGYRKTLEDFAQSIITIHDNRVLADELSSLVKNSLNIHVTHLYLIENHNFYSIRPEGAGITRDKTSTLSKKQYNILINNKLISGTNIHKYFQHIISEDIGQIIPLMRQNKLLGLWIIGMVHSRGNLDEEDISLLLTISSSLALAIENNQYLEASRQLVKEVTEARIRDQYTKQVLKKNEELKRLYSDLKTAQTQLVQSEKMSSLGQLVAGIAHELNNPIGFIYANTKILEKYRQQLQSQPDDQELLTDMENVITDTLEGTSRIKAIVQDLRNFSRIDEAEFKKADIHEGLDTTIKLLRKELGERIRLEKQYGEIPLIMCKPGHLNQVFMNILMNAIQSIEDKGAITISTSIIGKMLCLRFQDTGSGIDEHDLEKVFDPFFTTKPVGKGTGLGLSISYGIIKDHHGQIHVSRNLSGGSTFTIELPLNPENNHV